MKNKLTKKGDSVKVYNDDMTAAKGAPTPHLNDDDDVEGGGPNGRRRNALNTDITYLTPADRVRRLLYSPGSEKLIYTLTSLACDTFPLPLTDTEQKKTHKHTTNFGTWLITRHTSYDRADTHQSSSILDDVYEVDRVIYKIANRNVVRTSEKNELKECARREII